MLVEILPVKPRKENNLQQKYHTYIWFQDDTTLTEHSLIGSFQFGMRETKKIKYPTVIEYKNLK